MKKNRQTPEDFRRLIKSSLQKQEKSIYWLAAEVEDKWGTPTPNTIYRYLRGEVDIASESLGKILAVLGLAVK